jgi:sarcosine oxidase
MSTYDVIMLGLGAMGSAAAYACAQRGLKVLGLEQFAFGHDQGSSHGQSRIIREVYYEHPCYVPLVQESFTRWEELQQQTKQTLLFRSSCANIGTPDSPIIQGVQRAACEHHLAAETYADKELRTGLPQFNLPENYVVVLEARAGWLRVEDCVLTLQRQARHYGAELHERERVLRWKSDQKEVQVDTNRGSYAAKSLIITAGPWAAQSLQDLHLPLHVMRQVQLWFEPPGGDQYRSPAFPIFIVDTPNGAFYGLPGDAGTGLKLAQHYGAPELNSPAEIDRTFSDNDVSPVRRFLRQYLPAVADAALTGYSVCMYTLTPDRHFIIDRHPHHPNVALACGFSGHGFKFAPVVGEILGDLIQGVPDSRSLDLFRLDRFL